MAITFIDRYYSGHIAAGLNIPMTIPAGATTGDMMIAYCHQSENTTQRDWDDDGGGGNGWIQLANDRTTGGRDMETAIYYKVHDGAESNPTFTWATGITAEPMSGSLLVYRGCDTTVAPVFSYADATNDGNPPNPSVFVGTDNATVICIHSQTHDDVTSPSAPTGFTFRTNGWINSTADHMNHYIADITGISTGTYNPPDWQHTVANTTPEYHTYSIALIEPALLAIENQGDEQLDIGDTNEILTGFGFEATQGTGKVELGDNSDYATATKVTQSIDSWSDTSIQFDPVFTGFGDGSLWLFVTNDNGDRSSGYYINYGEAPYADYLKSLSPDIYHTFNNTYNDEQGVAAANSQTSLGSFGFVSTPITRNNTHSWTVNDNNSRIEMNDTIYTNITNLHTMRYIGGWMQFDRVHQVPSGFYEEGGGVNNLYMVIGFGNTLLGNVADSSKGFKIQAYSDFKLSVDRPYYCMIFFQGSGGTNEFGMYVDGVKVAKTDGNPMANTSMSTHSGDWCYGKPDGSLDTGGTDIAYPSATGVLLSDWATWSAVGGGAPLTDTECRQLFVRGAIATDTLVSGTGSAMQTALDVIAPKAYVDKPLPLKVYKPTDGGGDLTLDLDSVTFDDRCSIHILWMGDSGDTLTLINNGTSNALASKCETPYGGTITVVNPYTVTVSGMVDGSKITVMDSSDGTVLGNTESSSGDFNVSVQVALVDVVVIDYDFNIVRKNDISITGDTLVLITQETDYTYNNPA